jgi:pimeloyl-ACP methyl ester carboxylesterase
MSTAETAVALKHTEFCSQTAHHRGKPVILLHGLLGNKRNFATIGSALSQRLEKKRRILGVDLRNHGEYTPA